jgi:hypothetical protein
MKNWTVPALTMFLLVLFLAWFVWPTRYHYERLKVGQNEFPVRTDRVTGITEVFYPGGWVKREPSPPSPPQIDVPPSELAKLSTTARDNYGLLEVETYNGSGYRISEILVTISVYDAKHTPIIDRRVYRLTPSYPSSALDPLSSGKFSATVGFDIEPAETWEFWLTSAKGTQE